MPGGISNTISLYAHSSVLQWKDQMFMVLTGSGSMGRSVVACRLLRLSRWSGGSRQGQLQAVLEGSAGYHSNPRRMLPKRLHNSTRRHVVVLEVAGPGW